MKSLESVIAHSAKNHQDTQNNQIGENGTAFDSQREFVVALLATDTMTDLYIDKFNFCSAIGALLTKEHNDSQKYTYELTSEVSEGRTYPLLPYTLTIDHNSDSHLGITGF